MADEQRTIRDVYLRDLNATLHQRKDGDLTTVDFTLSGQVIETWQWTPRELTACDDPFGEVRRATDLIARVVAHIGAMPVKCECEQVEEKSSDDAVD